MKLKIRGCVRINAQGKKLYKFINLIHENGIECRGQYCRNDIFRCDIFRRDLKKLRRLAENCDVSLKTAEYDSLSARLYRYRKRIGLLLGLVLAAVSVLYFSRVVVTIEIEGNSAVSEEIILAALEELDIKAGTPLFRIDLPSSEKKLCSMVEELSWVGMRHTGSRVVVQVREAVPIPEMSRERVPCNIVASRDAKISSVLVRSGELKHIVGDFVPKGTLLISGVSENQKGQTFTHHAMGDVRGTYEETVCFSAPFRCEEYAPTGKSQKIRSLRLFSLDIPLSFGKKDFEHSSSEASESRLKLFGKELPIGIDQTHISETAPTEQIFSEEELSQRLMERVYLYENNFLGEDITILGRSIVHEKTDDILTLKVTYELESSICEQRDIFMK